MCICTYMYIYTHLHIHMYIYVYMIYIYICIYMYVYVYLKINLRDGPKIPQNIQGIQSPVRPIHWCPIWPKSFVEASPQSGFVRVGNCHGDRPLSGKTTCYNDSTYLLPQFADFGRFVRIALCRPLSCKITCCASCYEMLWNCKNLRESLWIASGVLDVMNKIIPRSYQSTDQSL